VLRIHDGCELFGEGSKKSHGNIKIWKVSRSSIYLVYQRDNSRITGHGTQKQDKQKRAVQSSSQGSDKLLCQKAEAKNSK